MLRRIREIVYEGVGGSIGVDIGRVISRREVGSKRHKQRDDGRAEEMDRRRSQWESVSTADTRYLTADRSIASNTEDL
jgi:hypothetical protein